MSRGGIRYGGDYNPEQWPEEVWAEDVALMSEAGVDLVTVGVFSWGELQASPGAELDAGWLDRVLDLLGGAGIGVDLATATASPPPWLAIAHPEILPVTAAGVRLSPGGRQHYCPSSPAYREAAVDLATRLAERYRGHPALELWHIGNEYGCHVPACYCDRSASEFRRWLQQRYHDVHGLNRAWGTAFWSQRYRSFDEVMPPRVAPTFPNPAQQLDYARFSNEELLACYRAEKAVLRDLTPEVPVTTNLMGLFRPTDGWAWAAEMDLVSVDRYPDPADADAHIGAALVADLTRSLGGRRPWYLMEQAPGAVNWRAVNVAKSQGQYRTWSLQAVARGADAVLQFQWRASAAGAEKFHSGMVPHAGTDTRQWRDVVALGADLRRLEAVAGQPVPADVAILLDWESWWGLELDSHPSSDLRQVDVLLEMYRPLHAAGVVVDVAHPSADLPGYRMVVVPALYSVSDGAAANLDAYVRAGGVAVVTYFSAIVDTEDRIRLGGYPAPWRDMLGLAVEEFAPMPVGATDRLEGPLAHAGSVARRWQERLQLRRARVLASVASGPLRGGAAVTVNDHGRGTAYYLATSPDPETTAAVLAHAAAWARVSPAAPVPPGVEAVRRGDHLFLINHTDGERRVDIGSRERKDLLTGSLRSGTVKLGPGEALVLAPAGGAVAAGGVVPGAG